MKLIKRENKDLIDATYYPKSDGSITIIRYAVSDITRDDSSARVEIECLVDLNSQRGIDFLHSIQKLFSETR